MGLLAYRHRQGARSGFGGFAEDSPASSSVVSLDPRTAPRGERSGEPVPTRASDARRGPPLNQGADGRGGGGGAAGSRDDGCRGARLTASFSSGVARRISLVILAASSAVPITRGVISSRSSVFSTFRSVKPKR